MLQFFQAPSRFPPHPAQRPGHVGIMPHLRPMSSPEQCRRRSRRISSLCIFFVPSVLFVVKKTKIIFASFAPLRGHSLAPAMSFSQSVFICVHLWPDVFHPSKTRIKIKLAIPSKHVNVAMCGRRYLKYAPMPGRPPPRRAVAATKAESGDFLQTHSCSNWDKITP